MPDYRVYVPGEDGKLRDVTFSKDSPLPGCLVTGMDVSKAICLYLARALEKDWEWNKNYPKEVARLVAELVCAAMDTP